MGDKRVGDYFRNFKDQYDLEHLKQKVLSMGYTVEDINDAIVELHDGKDNKDKSEEKEDILKVHEAAIQDFSVPVSKTGITPGTVPVQGAGLPGTASTVANIPTGSGATPVATMANPNNPVTVSPPQNIKPATNLNQPNVNNAVSSGPATPLNASSSPFEMGTEGSVKGKASIWFKIAGISGILGFLLAIVAFFPIGTTAKQSVILGALFLFLIYFVGFILLGKRHNKKLISVISWIFIILIFLSMIFIVTLMIKPDLINFSDFNSFKNDTSASDIWNSIKGLGAKWLSIVGFVLGLLFILGILFGSGFLKLKEDIKLAKVTGLLFLVGSIMILIGIGPLILFVAFVLSVVVLSKE
jgi:hypothetical protein